MFLIIKLRPVGVGLIWDSVTAAAAAKPPKVPTHTPWEYLKRRWLQSATGGRRSGYGGWRSIPEENPLIYTNFPNGWNIPRECPKIWPIVLWEAKEKHLILHNGIGIKWKWFYYRLVDGNRRRRARPARYCSLDTERGGVVVGIARKKLAYSYIGGWGGRNWFLFWCCVVLAREGI